MFNPSRDEVRDFFFGVWKKYDAKAIMTPLETQALDWVLEHPEYQPLLAAPEKYRDKDYLPEFGETNPFLHLSLHLSVTEQVSIDQPPGLRGEYESSRKSTVHCTRPYTTSSNAWVKPCGARSATARRRTQWRILTASNESNGQ